LNVAERARRELANAVVHSTRGDVVPVTASFGVAQLVAGETIEQLIDRADRAMYTAKSSGRNRVEHAHSTIPMPLTAPELHAVKA
jgi:diguanylate cyclase (GGDEF)-like protein